MKKTGFSTKKQGFFGLDSSIHLENKKKWRGVAEFDVFDGTESIHTHRFYVFYIFAFLILFVFLGRLFGLTIVSGAKNRELSENNRVHLIEVEAPRGKIFDRNGQVLAYSATVYFLTKGKESKEITKDQAEDFTKKGFASTDFEGNLGKIERLVVRKYPYGEATAHVLGYTSMVQEEELKADKNIIKTNAKGRLGIEESYNDFLEGKVGKKLIEVDASGNNVSILGEQAAVEGRNLRTTIDANLEKVAYESLKKWSETANSKKGAVIVENPNSGEVLALVSAPSFNPEDIGRAVADQNKPFFNRVIQGNYPPGSVFKISVALAGLESGKIDRNTEIEDVGVFELGGVQFSNWYFSQYGKTEGLVKIDKAIARSNDIFFYRAAERTGLDNLRKMAISFGFGQQTGIDLPNEAYGLVPDEVWKKSTIGDGWFTGDTMHLGIGQGFMLTTPIQISSMTSYVAGGKLTKPYIVSQVEGTNGSNGASFGSKILKENLASAQNLDLVRLGMGKACEIGGTGAPFFRAKYKVACKTGTAEEVGKKPHAWFTVFAPIENPEIAVTVLVENGGEGSAIAAPIAKEILDWWYEDKFKN